MYLKTKKECKPKTKLTVKSYDPDAPTYDPSLDVNGYAPSTLEEAVSEFGEMVAENFIVPALAIATQGKKAKARRAARQERKKERQEARQEKRISRIKGRQELREARVADKIKQAQERGLKSTDSQEQAQAQADQVNQLAKAVQPGSAPVSSSQVPSASTEGAPSYATLDMPTGQEAPQELETTEQAPEAKAQAAEIDKAVPTKKSNKTTFLIIGILAIAAVVYFIRKKG